MNFSFMIILLLVLMIYISISLNINKYYLVLYTLFLLILGEIYNIKEYKKERFVTEAEAEAVKVKQYLEKKQQYSFQEDTSGTVPSDIQDGFKEKYSFVDTFDPYDYSRHEFEQVKIPNDYNTNLEKGLSCEAQKRAMDYIKQKEKILSQQGYTQKYQGYLTDYMRRQYYNQVVPILKTEKASQETNPTRKTDLTDIINFYGTKPVTQQVGDFDASVFDPIESDPYIKNRECPTVCHIIEDKNRCKRAKYIPYMSGTLNENKTTMNGYYSTDPDYETKLFKNAKLDKCTAYKKDMNKCNSDPDCSFDIDYKTCNYDKLGCFYHDVNVPKNDTKCHTRCEFLNKTKPDGNTDYKKSRANCANATFFDSGKNKYINYCEWSDTGDTDGECIADCSYYGNDPGYSNESRKNECTSDTHCDWDDTQNVCKKKT